MIKLNANQYRINIPSIKHLTKELSKEARLEFISNLAIITGVPIIIVCCYVGEIYGFTPDLLAKIEYLKKFYTVDEVLNVKGDGITWAGKGHPVTCKCEE